MKFLRSIIGTAEREQAPGEEISGRPAGQPDDAADEAKHELDLQRNFSRGLSDLGQRQLQYEKYRWEPPAQTDPRGTWFVTEEVETDELVLRPGTALEFVERAGSGATAPWRMRTTEGRTLELPIQEDADAVALPAGLSRSSPESREAG